MKHTIGELGGMASSVVELLHVVGNHVTQKAGSIAGMGEFVQTDPLLPLELLEQGGGEGSVEAIERVNLAVFIRIKSN